MTTPLCPNLLEQSEIMIQNRIRSESKAKKGLRFRSPWQNGIAERFVGSYRRELLDHVIVLNEHHLNRLINDYVRYYLEDRTHLGLAKETPANRPTEKSPGPTSIVVS